MLTCGFPRMLTWILLTASAMDLGASARNHRPKGSGYILAGLKACHHTRASASTLTDDACAASSV